METENCSLPSTHNVKMARKDYLVSNVYLPDYDCKILLSYKDRFTKTHIRPGPIVSQLAQSVRMGRKDIKSLPNQALMQVYL